MLEAIELISAALRDETIGINAQLATLETGSYQAPSDILITDSVSNLELALGLVPEQYPQVCVRQAGDWDITNQVTINGNIQYSTLPIGLWLVLDVTDNPTESLVQLSLLQRATLRTLQLFHSNEYAHMRTLRGIQLQDCQSCTLGNLGTLEEGKNTICIPLTLTYRVRNLQP